MFSLGYANLGTLGAERQLRTPMSDLFSRGIP